MKNVNISRICDVCKRPMRLVDSRIEWVYSPNTTSTLDHVHICHHDCSHGVNDSTILLGDIIFKEDCDFTYAYERLPELQATYSDHADEFSRIFSILFK